MSNFARLHLCNKVSFEYPKPPISFIVFANEYVTDRCHIQDISSRLSFIVERKQVLTHFKAKLIHKDFSK